MCRKLIYVVPFILVLGLVCAEPAFGIVIERRIARDTDDAEEQPGGSMYIGSSDLEMPYEGTGKSTLQIIGLRFTDLAIPKGAQVMEAWVQFQVDETKGGTEPVSLLIEGELTGDATTFGAGTSDISNRPRTTAKVVWDVPNWTSVGAQGPDQQTSDISTIIQEIVNQAGWASGNALVLIFSDNPDNPSSGVRCAEAVQAVLHVKIFTVTATDPNPADGTIGVPTPLLQWTPGDSAAWNDVYFGTDPNLGPDDFMGRQPFAMYWHAPGFTPNTTYYWRIDSVEADGTTIHTGDVWSFTSAPFAAYDPDPPNGSKTARPDTVLSWSSGATAITHDVYLGTSRADVAAGTGGTFKGNQPAETYNPGGLQTDTTYFWRIDEVEADGTTKHPGEVWTFRTLADPDFIAWYKLDEMTGIIAYDSSGYGNHGSFGPEGDPRWVPGYFDGAVELDGDDDYVEINSIADDLTDNNFSVCAWIKTTQTGDGNVIGANTSGSGHDFIFGVDQGNLLVEADSINRYPPAINNNQWHHIAYVRDGANAYAYTDGKLVGTETPSGNPSAMVRWSIGMEWDSSPSDEFDGIVDDVRFYGRPLTVEEIAEVMRGEADLAHHPKPAHGSTPDIEHVTRLSWLPGDMAAQHDVYFGTEEFPVGSADTSDTTGIYRGRQVATSYTPPESLEIGQTYYWRIDEFNTDATISTGRIWSFTVANYLVVDDFEDYNDYEPDRIFDTWIDGWGVPANGSQVGYDMAPFAEQTIVHGGSQSMPFFYDNTGGVVYSEAERTFAVPQDWTRRGVTSLTLWFRGLPASVGSFTAGPPVYTMTADGADIWGTADQFHYAFKRLSGLGSIQAKVLSVTNTHNWAKAGVMIRETLEPGSTFAAVYITPGNGCRFQLRNVTDGSATSDSSVATAEQRAITAPYWVKLERTAGGRFNAYYSSNPATDPWHLMVWSPQMITMPTDVYIGLALTSHNSDPTVVCTAEFSDVSTTGTVTGQWQSQDIGIESNVADQLYVALADSANRSATVKHADPAATTIDTWTEWNIDLTAFTGVSLQSIKRMSIGVGDKAGLQAGGSGLLYIDDIWLKFPPPPAQ